MELVNITYTGPGFQEQSYTNQDIQLLTSNLVNTQFGDTHDYIEYFVYDVSGQLLDVNYKALDYYPSLTANAKNNLYSSITLDPKSDLQKLGYTRGSLNTQYNFLKNLLNSSFGKFYWIKEISNSRTEIKLASQTISDSDILTGFNQYQSFVSSKNYYTDFYLNFGNNELIIGTNVAYTTDSEGAYILIKLYEPLPIDYDVKTQLWVVNKVAESVNFKVDIQVEAEVPQIENGLRGPNFHVKTTQTQGQTTPYYNYTNLLSSNVSSSFQQLMSYYQDKSVNINVDYSNFSNFIHFSSATERLNNFVYKVRLIESYNAQLYSSSLFSGGATSNQLASSSIGSIQSSINNLVEKFDPYEYYLYFSSGSYSWPKRTSTKPYQLYSVSSSQASNWLGGISIATTATTQSMLYSASYYDYTNKDLLKNTVPQYIIDDDNNAPYMTFLDMIGQHFDNIWIYYKDVSNRFNSTNNPGTGISLDLVADALKGLGINLYTNTNISNNIYYSLFGVNQDGSLLPPTGSEVINNYVTSNLQTLSADQIQKELYKRLYHNLPYLLKSRGTQRGVKALISTFGIPNDILSVNEFGGYDRTAKDGIYTINNDKVNIITGSYSASLSSSLLSPETTIQYYTNDSRLNIPSIEVGFSPANNINAYITGTIGYFNIDQYIGNPNDYTSGSYPSLDILKTNLFNTLTNKHSINEYIRLIKYYNNSVFKMIKDFVPAKSSLSTGVIVKSHILERNKYARHQPSASVFNNFTQSLQLVSATGSGGSDISGSTKWSGYHTGSLGYIPFTSSQNVEKITGQFGGAKIVVTNLDRFKNQYEVSKNFTVTASGFVTQSFSATYQNVTQSVRSQRFLRADYNSSQAIPSNYGILTQSLSSSQNNLYAQYTNPNSPYAYMQDTNYYLQSFTTPRYYGSKTTSATYTDYTIGDSSYGKTAAIDKIKFQYAYLINIYSSSFQMPGRANAQIKYIIDNSQNILDLTKQNNNIFTTQNVFKSGETVNIALFDYSPDSNTAQYLTNNQSSSLFEGGYRYSPVLYNIDTTNNDSVYQLFSPIAVTTTFTNPSNVPVGTSDANYWAKVEMKGTRWTGYALLTNITASLPNTSPSTRDTIINYSMYNLALGSADPYYSYTTFFTVPSGTSTTYKFTTNIPSDYFVNGWDPAGTPAFDFSSSINYEYYIDPSGGTTSTSTTYTSSITDSDSRWYTQDFVNIRLSATQSLYYNNFLYSGSSALLDNPVIPFSLGFMDTVRFYNSASGWSSSSLGEYRVNQISTVSSGSTTYYQFTLDRPLDPIYTDTGTSGSISRYIALKRLPDETNLIMNFKASSNVTNTGLIFPQYIDKAVQDNSGNVIKSLKQQNLI